MQTIIISSRYKLIPNISNKGSSISLKASGWKFKGPIEVGKKENRLEIVLLLGVIRFFEVEPLFSSLKSVTLLVELPIEPLEQLVWLFENSAELSALELSTWPLVAEWG